MAARISTVTKSQILDINDLADILDLLKRHGYSGTSYYKLGLFLGLLSRTLDVIAKNNSTDVSSCLLDCLKEWLKEADNVKEKGDPSYYSLIQALRKLEENAVADGIDREKHPACVIFTQCSNECIVAALPSLAILLHKEKIIDEILVPTTAEVLLKAMKKAVCADYHNLGKFAEILKELQNTSSVGQSLMDEYKRSFPGGCALITVGKQIKMTVPLDLCSEFTGMREKFSVLRIDVANAMKKKKVKIKELKEYFSENKKHLRSHIASCKKIKELICLIGDECSLLNYVLLEGAVNRFKVEEAKPAIEKYRKEIDEFYKEGRPLRDFLDKRLGLASPLLQYKAVIISVHNSVDEFELKDINILMTNAFQKMAPEVALEFVREGNSFTITCSFPAVLSESLIATALDNVGSLIERGVKKLSIGYSTVYDHDKLFQHDETATSKKYTMTSEMKQQLYASVYSNQGTMEQLLISRTIQLLNSEEELASVQQVRDEKEKLEAEVKVLSGMKWEVSQLRTRQIENVKEIEMLQEKISVQGMEILEKEGQQKQSKFLETREMEMKAELKKIDGLLYSLLQQKDTELQEVIQLQQVEDTQYLQAKRVFLEHSVELSIAMAVTPNRLSVVKQLYGSNLISETSFHQATEGDAVSGIETGIVLMNDLKASINQKPDLISSLVAVLEGNETFQPIAKRIGKVLLHGKSEQQRKRAAKKAITGNTSILNDALSSSEDGFHVIVSACVDCEMVTAGEQAAFLDSMSGKTLQARVQGFVTQITSVVEVLPDLLDEFVLILFNAGNVLTWIAAKEIATKYGYKLPKYESAGGSVAVVSDSVGPSPIDTTNAGSAQSSSPQVSGQGKEEPVKSGIWGIFGSKKEKKNDEEKVADKVVYKYDVNETGEHGVVLIINNVYFKEKDKPDRISSTKDAERLEEVFKGLRYQVIVQEDLEADEIKMKVSAVATGLVTKKHDSFICCILSHGNPAGIEGVDGKTVTIPELANIVNSMKCSALRGKPKIFFFGGSRGTEVPEPSTADSSVPWPQNKDEEMVAYGVARALPPEADFLFGFSTSDGNVAARGVYTGSQYIKALCEFIPKYASRLSLYELLLLVNYKVSENPIDYKMSYKYHQMPEIRNTLRGKFYFKK